MALQDSGLYIAFEGIDGSGKSSLLTNVSHKLNEHHIPVHCTKEPGGSALGKTIRQLLQQQPVTITSKAEFLLFAADRAQHINQIVHPHLKQGHVVLSDRCADSSVVYQGYGRGLDVDMITTINTWATESLQPHITFYVKIDRETARQRIATRNETITAFESQQASFFDRLINGYDTLYRNRTDVITLDGTLPQETLTEQAFNALQPYLNHE